MPRTVRVGLVLCLVVGVRTASADRPIDAAKLVLERFADGREKLTFVSRDAAFLFPTLGSGDDPSTGGSTGLVVELFAAVAPAGVALSAPPGSGIPGWRTNAGTPAKLVFKNGAAPDAFATFRTITLEQGRRIRIDGRRSGLPLTTPLGAVGIRITMGTLRSCALFDAPTVRRDVPGRFAAREATSDAIADCSNASLGGVSPTTSTSTTLPVVCGDGVVDPSSEQCDGNPQPGCPGQECGPPGTPHECQCCSGAFANPGDTCCDPSATLVIPSFGFGGSCVSLDCSGPFPCTIGHCEPEGYCCSGIGQPCAVPLLGGGVFEFPCCLGLQCAAVGPVLTCCAPREHACSSDADCCSLDCDLATLTCNP